MILLEKKKFYSPQKTDTPYEIGQMIPTSCEDLSKIGHTVNGIFLVNKAGDTNEQKLKLSAVFCDFQPPSSISNYGI